MQDNALFNTPILFLIFNRLGTTQKVFQKIREIKPQFLFIAADGPRFEKEGEKEKVEAVRKYVLDHIDWKCEIKTLFRESNLGCGKAVSQAITWFFENVEQGIILEDDCLPDLSFFGFCEELLEFYKSEEYIYHITGNNFQKGIRRGEASYYFSSYATIWGWATWRRAWQKYDLGLQKMNVDNIDEVLDKNNFDQKEKKFWLKIFYSIKNNEIDTWDYQWSFIIWYHQGISIVPNVNLISNIGFDEDATHVKNKENALANLPTQRMILPLIKNNLQKRDAKADKFLFENGYNITQKKAFGIKNIVSKIIKMMEVW